MELDFLSILAANSDPVDTHATITSEGYFLISSALIEPEKYDCGAMSTVAETVERRALFGIRRSDGHQSAAYSGPPQLLQRPGSV
jgi:hypothetical protein